MSKNPKPVEFYFDPFIKKGFLKHRNLSIREFAKILGYSEEQTGQILNGKIEPSMQFMHRFCYVTGLHMSDAVCTRHNKVYRPRGGRHDS